MRKHIFVAILLRKLIHRTPCSHIAPAKVAATHIDILGLFHYTVVDRYGFTFSKDLLYGLCLALCTQRIISRIKERMVLGKIGLESSHNRVNAPYKKARIPHKFTTVNKGLGDLQRRLLGEALHSRNDVGIRLLQIAISRIGTARLDAHSHQGIMLGNKLKTLIYSYMEFSLIQYQMIRRSNNHPRILTALTQSVCSISNSRSRITTYRLAENLLGCKFGNMLQHQVAIGAVGNNQKILLGH